MQAGYLMMILPEKAEQFRALSRSHIEHGHQQIVRKFAGDGITGSRQLDLMTAFRLMAA